MFADSRPGPLPANRAFLERHPEFEYDRERNEKFLLTHHPLGWLRRRTGSARAWTVATARGSPWSSPSQGRRPS